MNRVYIFAHIPKNGGTSLRAHFQEHLKNHKEFIHLSDKGNLEAIKNNLKPFNERPLKEQEQSKVILGHNVNCTTGKNFKEKKVFRVIVFRDPKDWLISKYNQAVHDRKYNNKPHLEFSKWINAYPNMFSQFNWFLSEYLKLGKEAFKLSNKERANLIVNETKKFDLVINLSKLGQKTKPIMNELNIPALVTKKNVSKERNKNKFEKTEENLKKVERLIVNERTILNNIQFN